MMQLLVPSNPHTIKKLEIAKEQGENTYYKIITTYTLFRSIGAQLRKATCTTRRQPNIYLIEETGTVNASI